MGDRYHYDKDGNYKGMSSSTPPGNDTAGCLAVIFIVIFFVTQCGSSRPPRHTQKKPPAVEHQSATLTPK